MNKVLHTWNFLGHRSFLRRHCYLLREHYPVFFFSLSSTDRTKERWRSHGNIRQKTAKNHTLSHTHTHSCTNTANITAARQRHQEKICSVGKIKHLPLTGWGFSRPLILFWHIMLYCLPLSECKALLPPQKDTISMNASAFCLPCIHSVTISYTNKSPPNVPQHVRESQTLRTYSVYRVTDIERVASLPVEACAAPSWSLGIVNKLTCTVRDCEMSLKRH